MIDLKAIYETKREIMEQIHKELLNALESEEKKLKRRGSKLQESTKELNEEYEQTSLRLEIKKQVDKFIGIFLVTFIAVVLGSWLVLGFVDIIRQLGNMVSNFFKI